MQKHILAVVLMFFAMSSSAWAECGKLCDRDWWETATASDVQAELDAGVDVNARGGRPLHSAVIGGTAEGVQLLITAGADVNTTYWLLHLAVERGTAEMVQLLIAAGADVHLRDTEGYTPLHWAAALVRRSVRSDEMVQLLIAAGADITARNERGDTPLHSAAWQNTAEIVQLLITAGADITARNSWGRTPLHSAADDGTAEMVQLLITAGADITARDDDGTSVWDLAQTNKRFAGTETFWSLADALGKCSRLCDAGWWKQTTAADLQTLLDAGAFTKLTKKDRETAWNLAKSSPLKGSKVYWALNDARFK